MLGFDSCAAARRCTAFRLIAGLAVGVLVGLVGMAGSAKASPLGIWFEHTGRGAVEIVSCGQGLCGKLIWLKDQGQQEACGLDILGDVKPISAGRWDNGWILDPDFGQKFDVELTPLENGDLQVLGYAGIKALSQTMIWKRAPADLGRCEHERGVASR